MIETDELMKIISGDKFREWDESEEYNSDASVFTATIKIIGENVEAIDRVYEDSKLTDSKLTIPGSKFSNLSCFMILVLNKKIEELTIKIEELEKNNQQIRE